jgi:hypothetical protein
MKTLKNKMKSGVIVINGTEVYYKRLCIINYKLAEG